jgi:hypothetical protein
LFREFAETYITTSRATADQDRSDHAIIEFANKYGVLGLNRKISWTNTGGRLHGELHSDWYDEIAAMKRSVAVWEAFEAGDSAFLESVINFEESGVSFDSQESDMSYTIASTDWRADAWQFIETGNHFDAAICFVQQIVNKHLAGRISPRLLWSDHRDIGMHQVPSSLVGAMWLQFGRAIDGRKSFHPCRSCGTWIEVSTTGARSSRKFCSGACRSRNYRARREEAAHMYGRGHTHEEIAGAMQASSETVAKWVGSTRRDEE